MAAAKLLPLTFAYQTSGEPFVIRMLESQILRPASPQNAQRGEQAQDGKVDSTNTIVEDMLKSPTWAQYQAVVRTNKYVNTGFVQISPFADQLSLSRIELKMCRLFTYRILS